MSRTSSEQRASCSPVIGTHRSWLQSAVPQPLGWKCMRKDALHLCTLIGSHEQCSWSEHMLLEANLQTLSRTRSPGPPCV